MPDVTQWRGMPEFVQRDLMPFKTIYVHFQTREDMEAFAKLVGQRIGLKTKSIWYPQAEKHHRRDYAWVDGEAEQLDDAIELTDQWEEMNGIREYREE